MNERRRDLKQTAMAISRARLEVKWTARDLGDAGFSDHASVLNQLGEDMDQVEQRLYEWSEEHGTDEVPRSR